MTFAPPRGRAARTLGAAPALVVFLLSGCRSVGPRPPEPGGACAVAPSTAPAAPAIRERAITLFGEIPGSQAIPFESRPAGSLAQHTNCPEGADFDPAVDASGRLLAFASTRHSPRPDIYTKPIGGAGITQITSDPASDIQPEFSPDGGRIAFASDRAGNFDIWMIGADGQGATQLTNDPAHEVHPTWAPDGQRIAYCMRNPKGGQWELWLLDLRQPGTRKFIGHGLYPRWSPVEDLIVYQRARERGQRWFGIWTIRLVDNEPRFPTEIAASATEAYILPTFSRDGKQIAFCAVRPEDGTGGASEIWTIDAGGGEPVRLTEGEASYSPAWGGDGRVYFAGRRGGAEAIWSVRPVRSVTASQPGTPPPRLERTAFRDVGPPGGAGP